MPQRAALSLVARARGVSLLGCVQTDRRGKVASHIRRATQGRELNWLAAIAELFIELLVASLLVPHLA